MPRYGYATCPGCGIKREFREYRRPDRLSMRWVGRGCNHTVPESQVHIMPEDA